MDLMPQPDPHILREAMDNDGEDSGKAAGMCAKILTRFCQRTLTRSSICSVLFLSFFLSFSFFLSSTSTTAYSRLSRPCSPRQGSR